MLKNYVVCTKAGYLTHLFLFILDFNRKYTKMVTIFPDVIFKKSDMAYRTLTYETELSETTI